MSPRKPPSGPRETMHGRALDLLRQPHRRFNALTNEWILVSPHRTERPWLGQTETSSSNTVPIYDPACYMCPGNNRAPGLRNPSYESTFVFDNDYPALLPTTPDATMDDRGLLVAGSETGTCRVLCFSPRHDLTIATMALPGVRAVVDQWAHQFEELGALPFVNYVQIFENRGAMMGASNPHPHGQIWASASIPNEPAKELRAQQQYHDKNGACLLCNYLALERERGDRMVFENESFTVVVPFWAIWPFETMLLPNHHATSLLELSDRQRDDLAAALGRITSIYDQLFDVPFPYSMGFHQAPTDGQPHPASHMHAHFYPPLLRSATIRKFMVGYEMLATPQRDLAAEASAARLRQLVETIERHDRDAEM